MLVSRLSFLLVLVLPACTKSECRDGAEPVPYEVFACDEVRRVCETRIETACPCDGPECIYRGPYADSKCQGITGVAEWLAQEPSTVTHIVDGAFTGEEWNGATKLQGMFTDVYMDYRDGRLYFLNDWRVNDQGIRPDCFNYFQIRVGEDYLDLRVFGDGRVEVTRNYVPVAIANQGAYGFGPSPAWATPHTIYEFSLALPATQIDVCCFDPVTFSQCDKLTREPVVMALRPSGAGVQVARQVAAGVPRLPNGANCGSGAGVCEDGQQCEDVSGDARCVGPATPDAGPAPDAGPDPYDGGLPI